MRQIVSLLPDSDALSIHTHPPLQQCCTSLYTPPNRSIYSTAVYVYILEQFLTQYIGVIA